MSRRSAFACACLFLLPRPSVAEELSEVVVTGRPGGADQNRQEATFSITTISAEQIAATAPRSSADLLTQLPGVWVESSGGVSGANINVLGFPEAGDAPHVTFSINGAPIFPVQTLSFMEHSSLFRVDETIATVEGQLGGPGAVFSRGEPGLTANFRLKRGRSRPEALVRYTASDEGLNRVAAVFSGQAASDLYYMIGGYLSSAPGLHDPGFNAEKGRQLTLNLVRELSRGEIAIWSRYTNDHGQWLLPVASNSGNDLRTFTQLDRRTRRRELQVGVAADGRPIYDSFDFADGRGWSGSVSGFNATVKLTDAITLRDNFSYTSGNADTYGLVPDGGAVRVASLPGTSLAGAGIAATASGGLLGGQEFIQNYGYWVVQKKLRSGTNDLSATAQVGAQEISLGFYAARWSSDDFWTIGNFVPFHNVSRGELLNPDPVRGPARSCEDLQRAGSGSGCWAYGLRSAGDATARALYAADSIRVSDAFRIDLGARIERQSIDYVLDSGPGYPLNVTSLDVRAAGTERAYTAAFDYEWRRAGGVFARYTKGFAFPNFDSFRNNDSDSAAIQAIRLSEIGYKLTSPNWKLYGTAFRSTTDAFSGDVGSIGVTGDFRSRAFGVQVDGAFVGEHFGTRLIGTWQRAIYTSGDPAIIDRRVMRQPNVQIRLMPQYRRMLGSWGLTLSGSAAYIGRRFADNINSLAYGSYTTFDATIELDMPRHWSIALHEKNLTNRLDPTEGDPRSTIAANYRPILGRETFLSVQYQL